MLKKSLAIFLRGKNAMMAKPVIRKTGNVIHIGNKNKQAILDPKIAKQSVTDLVINVSDFVTTWISDYGTNNDLNEEEFSKYRTFALKAVSSNLQNVIPRTAKIKIDDLN